MLFGGGSHTLLYLFVESLAEGPETGPFYCRCNFLQSSQTCDKIKPDLSALFRIHFS
jgi:hypothetical protein